MSSITEKRRAITSEVQPPGKGTVTSGSPTCVIRSPVGRAVTEGITPGLI
jgi:hypothetical protein